MIAQTIQLALAPVFVLVAIGNLLNLLAGRLGRVVDRARSLQARYKETEGDEHDEVVREIRSVDQRIAMINRAMLLLVVSALMIALVTFLAETRLASSTLRIPARLLESHRKL